MTDITGVRIGAWQLEVVAQANQLAGSTHAVICWPSAEVVEKQPRQSRRLQGLPTLRQGAGLCMTVLLGCFVVM